MAAFYEPDDLIQRLLKMQFFLDGLTGSFEILILFLFDAGLFFGVVGGLGFSNLPKSILSPTVFKPLNFV